MKTFQKLDKNHRLLRHRHNHHAARSHRQHHLGRPHHRNAIVHGRRNYVWSTTSLLASLSCAGRMNVASLLYSLLFSGSVNLGVNDRRLPFRRAQSSIHKPLSFFSYQPMHFLALFLCICMRMAAGTALFPAQSADRYSDIRCISQYFLSFSLFCFFCLSGRSVWSGLGVSGRIKCSAGNGWECEVDCASRW
jgi:hypothetical protein